MTTKKIDWRLKVAEEAADALVGHIAMDSVTDYVVTGINEKYGTSFEYTSELIELCEKLGVEIVECDHCGWYVEHLEEHEEDSEFVGCDDCVKYHDIEPL